MPAASFSSETDSAGIFIPAAPATLQYLLKTLSLPLRESNQLREILALDPGMTALFLKQSPDGEFPVSLEELEAGALMLGLQSCTLSSERTSWLNQLGLRSLSTSLINQQLASVFNLNPAHMKRLGLLCEVGGFAMAAGKIPAQNGEETGLACSAAEIDLHYESNVYGINRYELGAEMLLAWGLPRQDADVIRFHHLTSDKLIGTDLELQVTALAKRLSGTINSATDIPTAEQDIFAQLRNQFGQQTDRYTEPEAPEEALRRMLASAAEKFGDIKEHLDADESTVDLKETVNQAILMRLAVNTLSVNSLSAVNHYELSNSALKQVLIQLLPITDVLVFHSNEAGPTTTWNGQLWSIPVGADSYLLKDEAVMHLSHRDKLSVVDQQLFGRLGANHLIIVNTGVSGHQLVIGLTKENSLKQLTFMVLARHFGSYLEALSNPRGIPLEEINRRGKELIHEANNPLATIQNYLKILALKLGEEHPILADLDVVGDELQRVSRIIDGIRDIGSNENQQPIKEVNVNALINDLIGIMEKATPNITFAFQQDQNLKDQTLVLDSFKQIVTNLIKNAVEAIDGDGAINVSTQSNIYFSGRQYWSVKISDTGPGIPGDLHQRIFEPGYSSKGTHNSGLGLSICQKLVTEMDGQLMLTSTTDSRATDYSSGKQTGTEIEIYLPYLPSESTDEGDLL